MPVRYDGQTRAKAVRLVQEHKGDYDSEFAAIKAVSSRLGMTAETLRKWIRQSEVGRWPEAWSVNGIDAGVA